MGYKREAMKGSGGPELAVRCAGNRQAECRESQGVPQGATMRVPRINVPQAGSGAAVPAFPSSKSSKNRRGAEGDNCDSETTSSVQQRDLKPPVPNPAFLYKTRPRRNPRSRSLHQENQALKTSSLSLPSLLATAMAATESPTQLREVTSISIGRLIARIRV